ncbi:MAG TPA: CvpA family protein [Terriglobales bacterium]|nr:CvpA family protein [Terriglobales bacterium]
MSSLDWLILSVVLVSVLMAAGQGLFVELFSLGGAVVGYWLAAWQHARVAAWFAPHVRSDAVADAAGFLTVFVLVMVLAGMLGRFLSGMMKETGLRWIDRLLGAVFGLVRGVVVATVVIMVLAAFVPESRVLAGSVFGPYVLKAGRMVARVAPQEVRERFLKVAGGGNREEGRGQDSNRK